MSSNTKPVKPKATAKYENIIQRNIRLAGVPRRPIIHKLSTNNGPLGLADKSELFMFKKVSQLTEKSQTISNNLS